MARWIKKAILPTVISVGLSISLLIGLCYYVYSLQTAIIGKEYEASMMNTVSIMEGLPPWVTGDFLLACLELQDNHGIYASVTIAQAQQEVGGTWNGTSLYSTASMEHNYFGLKATGGLSEWLSEITWDGTRGATGTYRKYTSISQGLKDRARLLLTGRPYTAIATTANGREGSQAQLLALSSSAWCEGQYNTLEQFMLMYQLARLDTMTVASYKAQYGVMSDGGGTFDGTFLYYNQAEPQWGSLTYVRGKSIASSGCAATALAMIWATYGKNTSITPATIFDIGNGNGALVNGWLSRDGCVAASNNNPQYGVTAVHTNNWTAALQALDKGGAVMVVGSGSPPFTSGGHWFVIIGYSGDTAYLADPGHRSCTWSQIGGTSSGESLSYIKAKTQDMIIFTPR